MTDEPLLKVEAPGDSRKSLPFGHHGQFRVCVAAEEDLPRCWHLVYQEYLASGYEKPGSSGYRYGIHDAIPGAVTFLIEADGEPIGTIAVYPDSPLGLPADHIYREELDGLRIDRGKDAGGSGPICDSPGLCAGALHSHDVDGAGIDLCAVAARGHGHGDDGESVA